jgi:hypothetical protein
VPRIERKTTAWYCEGLGLGSPAGLHGRHTDCPHATVPPHRKQRSYFVRIPAAVYSPTSRRQEATG